MPTRFPGRKLVVGRVERLAPTWVHPMHGGSLTADALDPEDPTLHVRRPALRPAACRWGVCTFAKQRIRPESEGQLTCPGRGREDRS